MDKLTALPVSGDAFLLRRGDRNILVDGGYSSQKLIAALCAPDVAIRHLHIVICTHADKDHAGGLTELLDTQSVRVDEFWLPGAWSDSLPELLRNPDLVVNALVDEFDEIVSGKTFDSVQQDNDEFESRVHASIAEARSNIRRESQGEGVHADRGQHGDETGLAWLKRQAADVDLGETDAAVAAKTFDSGRSLIKDRTPKRQLGLQWATFWIELIDTAERIRKIAVQAVRHEVEVRWFDFGEFAKTRHASGGELGLLVPLNAVEFVVPPPPIKMMSYMARLSPVNEECLVFFSSGGEWPGKLGVVFTGDSPMGDGRRYSQTFLSGSLSPLQFVVATAPHHGSESNAIAYKHLGAYSDVVLWLRSGGSHKHHPGSTFRKLPPSRRACTNCPHLKLAREVVEVQLSCFTSWPFLRVRARDCSC